MSLPKVEDAFEVWLGQRYPNFKALEINESRSLIQEMMRNAFFAGAKYGAAAGAPTLCRGCGSPLTPKPDGGGDFEACENCGYGKPDYPGMRCNVITSNGAGLFCDKPFGHEGECASDRPGESAKGGRADSPAGAKTSPAGDKSPVCAAVQFAGGLPCTFPRGHVGGMHSWNFTWANREVAS
jgi:hypothetical protein